MTRKKTPGPGKRDPRKIVLREPQPCEDEGEAQARELIRPNIIGAVSITEYAKGGDLTGVIYALEHEIRKVNDGDMSRAEGTLVTQAHTLDMLFNVLAQRASRNMEAGYLDATDRYLRLALKAQSQCRATLETLAEIKNPHPVAFVRQANIAAGHQLVNNGVEASRARENENQQSKLLEADNGKWMDIRTSGAAIRPDPAMATMGEINGAENH
jgi:hypothetical protein